MLKNILLLVLLFLWNHFFREIPYETIYAALIDLTIDRQALLLAFALAGGGLIVVSYVFAACGLYKITKALSVLTENISLSLIFAFGVCHAFFFVVLGENLYSDTGYLPPVLLFLLLFAAIKSQRIVDFNHPIRPPLLPAVIAALWPVLFVAAYSLL